MFKERKDAGVELAEKLSDYAGRPNVVILALPRGGVVVGAEIARRLKAPLDVFIVRKIGHPQQPELAAGAISETGSTVYNEDVIGSFGVSREYLRDEAARQLDEIARRRQRYRKGNKLGKLRDKTVILVDDGVATGATVKAAIQALKQEGLRQLVLAVPVAPPRTADELRSSVDRAFFLELPEFFIAVGNSYYDFPQVTDEEVEKILDDMRGRAAA